MSPDHRRRVPPADRGAQRRIDPGAAAPDGPRTPPADPAMLLAISVGGVGGTAARYGHRPDRARHAGVVPLGDVR